MPSSQPARLGVLLLGWVSFPSEQPCVRRPWDAPTICPWIPEPSSVLNTSSPIPAGRPGEEPQPRSPPAAGTRPSGPRSSFGDGIGGTKIHGCPRRRRDLLFLPALIFFFFLSPFAPAVTAGMRLGFLTMNLGPVPCRRPRWSHGILLHPSCFVVCSKLRNSFPPAPGRVSGL